MKKIISIEGMSCGHCVNHVKEALSELEGVKNVAVSLENKNAEIEIEKDIPQEKIKEIIEDLGYEVIHIK